MADHDDGRTNAAQFRLQPLDGRQIQMVGRLIQQQNVGLRRQYPGQGGAPAFAAGQMRRCFIALQAKLVQQIGRPVRIIARRQARQHIGHDIRIAGQIGFLGQITYRDARLDKPLATIRLDQAGGDLQQGGFAGAVAPHQTGPLARRNGQGRPLQQRRAAETEIDVA